RRVRPLVTAIPVAAGSCGASFVRGSRASSEFTTDFNAEAQGTRGAQGRASAGGRARQHSLFVFRIQRTASPVRRGSPALAGRCRAPCVPRDSVLMLSRTWPGWNPRSTGNADPPRLALALALALAQAVSQSCEGERLATAERAVEAAQVALLVVELDLRA